MNHEFQFLLSIILIGIGATIFMDLWAAFIKRYFGVPSLNYAMVGRWAGHLFNARAIHENIAKADPIQGEKAIGWSIHYCIGIVFAAMFLAVIGFEWLHHPTPIPAISFGILSVAAPFLILQPGMGAGIAASRMPKPNIMRLRSLMAHTSFGVGLYLSAWFLVLLSDLTNH